MLVMLLVDVSLSGLHHAVEYSFNKVQNVDGTHYTRHEGLLDFVASVYEALS